jgi:uncharacterized protein (TIGR03000 family)
MLRRTAAVAGTLFAAVLLLAPARGQQPATKPAARTPATLRVLMPAAAAILTVDGLATRQTGLTRAFESPPIEPGKDYTYTVVAQWMPNNYTTVIRTRVVPIKAGETTEVDLRKEDDKQKDEYFIRYVPTPQLVVEAMLKLADVGEKDVVYDLGCGDGRIVVTAVSRFKARRGVGVDLDPERIQDSKATARRAKVEDKVEFRQEDVLKLKDLGDASVVMLYLGDDVNERLKPILKKTLKPGSRIVSHRFTMGDWKPLKTISVKDVDGIDYELHLWKVGDDEK